MESLSVYVKKQMAEIQVGGWPIVKRKILRKIKRFVYKMPIFIGFYLCFSLIGYLTKTLLHRHSSENLERFTVEFHDLISGSLTHQSNKVNSILIEADRQERSQNINGVIALCKNAISIDSWEPEIYFKMASAAYLQGKFEESIKFYETGLKLLQETSVKKGLNLFGLRIINEWGNIGHIALFDVLVKLRMLGLLSQEKRVVFMRPESVVNLCYLNYWRPYLDIVFLDNKEYRSLKSFAYPIFEHLSMFKLKQGFTNMFSCYNLAENLWVSENRSPLLELDEVDKERGFRVLGEWSIPSQAWFVCLHVREGDRRITRSGPDSDILTYIPAIKSIISRGGWVIRMGAPGMYPLPTIPGLVDYANTKYKSDWMDVFLWASCKFLIGTNSGPIGIPNTFGVPVLSTNATHIGLSVNFKNSYMLPKLFWSRKENRFFTFKEMLDSPMGWTVSRVFSGIECNLVDNTSEEIETAVIEMLDKLEKPSDNCNSLTYLQKKFKSLQEKYGDTGQMTISDTFASKHVDLF